MLYPFKVSHGVLDFELTEEQAQRLRKERKQWHVGFLPTENIPSYSCGYCNAEYNESPMIQVTVNNDHTLHSYHTWVGYRCGHCNEFLDAQALETAEGIDPKYIAFDETGDFRRPTPEDIGQQLAKARESAEKGEGRLDHGNYTEPLRQAGRWASKIGYRLPQSTRKELATIYRQNFLRRTAEELPETVESIKKLGYAFSLRHTEDDGGMTPFEGFDLAEIFSEFKDTLPLIELPDDPQLRADIARILNSYERMFAESRDGLLEEKRKIDEQVAGEERAVQYAHNLLTAYAQRAGVTPDQLDEIVKTPLASDLF